MRKSYEKKEGGSVQGVPEHRKGGLNSREFRVFGVNYPE
jgi:hypothetical protein